VQSKEELVNTIERSWEEMSLEMIEVLLASMPHRMKAVIKLMVTKTSLYFQHTLRFVIWIIFEHVVAF